MCGIFGVTNLKENNLIKARESLDTLKHRGPDGRGEFYKEDVYIGHRRLSILDLSSNGSQPMISDDNKVLISVNGEIYNFKALKKDLLNKYNFKSTSDSEVILHGYREWGIEGLLDKIEGMYAFSIYDRTKNEIFLVRDRIGIKPLYYSKIDDQIVWASELKAIRYFYDDYNLEKDNTAYYDFLTYGYVPSPKTIFKNVFKLKPGKYLKINLDKNNITKHRYWSLKVDSRKVQQEEARKRVYELVSNSVKEQMVSDVPLGFFLSGGLDSSTVVALASEDNEENTKTFSIGFEDKSHDETHYADIVADKFNTHHEKHILDSQKVSNLFPRLKDWYDEPFADTSAFPTYLVSKIAKDNVTVVLTGDGGDEVFGGYNWYRKFKRFFNPYFKILKPLRKITTPLKKKDNIIGKIANRLEIELLLNDLELYTKLMGGMLREDDIKQTFRKKLNIPESYDDYWHYRKYYRPELPLMTRLQYLDFHTFLPDDILTKVDRVSMAVSLECRVPLLNTKLVEYLFSIDEEIRNKDFKLKDLMKETFRNDLPSEILNREKKGFSIPMYSWKEELVNNSKDYKSKILKLYLEKDGRHI